MKYFSLLLFMVVATIMSFISCNNNTESSKEVSLDSNDHKYNPAAEQKNTSTFNPKLTDTDTMYQNKDTVRK